MRRLMAGLVILSMLVIEIMIWLPAFRAPWFLLTTEVYVLVVAAVGLFVAARYRRSG